MTPYVPTIRLSLTQEGPRGRHEFATQLGTAFEQTGFAILVEHNISPELLATAYSQAQQVFSYPDEVLTKYETPSNGRQTGFTSKGVERAKNSQVPDLKRFLHIRRTLPPGHPRLADPAYVPNLWPDAEAPQFRPVMNQLFAELDTTSNEVGLALDHHLGYPSGTIPGMTANGEALLRVLHYMPLTADSSGLRAEQHEDINLYTLLPAATGSGLEVMNLIGEWVPVNEQPGSIVVNVGDMLQMLTKGRLRSTTHRVVNPIDPALRAQHRYSMPFFVHPRGEVVLDEAAGFTAGEFLQERLAEIGLKA